MSGCSSASAFSMSGCRQSLITHESPNSMIEQKRADSRLP
jgi:hypothetical protein